MNKEGGRNPALEYSLGIRPTCTVKFPHPDEDVSEFSFDMDELEDSVVQQINKVTERYGAKYPEAEFRIIGRVCKAVRDSKGGDVKSSKDELLAAIESTKWLEKCRHTLDEVDEPSSSTGEKSAFYQAARCCLRAANHPADGGYSQKLDPPSIIMEGGWGDLKWPQSSTLR